MLRSSAGETFLEGLWDQGFQQIGSDEQLEMSDLRLKGCHTPP